LEKWVEKGIWPACDAGQAIQPIGIFIGKRARTDLVNAAVAPPKKIVHLYALYNFASISLQDCICNNPKSVTIN
jgi:hypothetical protein